MRFESPKNTKKQQSDFFKRTFEAVILSLGGFGESVIAMNDEDSEFISGWPGNKEAICESSPAPRIIISNFSPLL